MNDSLNIQSKSLYTNLTKKQQAGDGVGVGEDLQLQWESMKGPIGVLLMLMGIRSQSVSFLEFKGNSFRGELMAAVFSRSST